MITISEIFSSFQGEGLYIGKPTIFVRFFGCNLKCAGFSQKNPMAPLTYETDGVVIPASVTDLKGIKNISRFGCDSKYSWSPEYKRFAKKLEVAEVVDEILRLASEELSLNDYFMNEATGEYAQICFTGGEPMLQQDGIEAILKELKKRQKFVRMITIETNGTVIVKTSFSVSHTHYSCSPKLYAVSGECRGINIDALRSICIYADSIAFKFVVNGTEESWDGLKRATRGIRKLRSSGDGVTFWVMPVGGTLEESGTASQAEIARKALKLGFNISPRTQLYIFGDEYTGT